MSPCSAAHPKTNERPHVCHTRRGNIVPSTRYREGAVTAGLVSAVIFGVMHVAVPSAPAAPGAEGADGGRGTVLARAGAAPLLEVPRLRQSQLAWHGEGGEGGEGRHGWRYRGYHVYPVPYPNPHPYPYPYPGARPGIDFELRIPLPPPWPSHPPPGYPGVWRERY